MNDPATLLAGLPALAFAFMLVLARVAGAVMLLPGLGEAELPPMLRAGLAVAITLLLLPALAPDLPPTPDAAWRGALMVVSETITGLWLGWLARLVVQAMGIAGHVIALMSGTASVVQPDAGTDGSVPASSRLLLVAAPILLLASGLYALPLQALAGSWRLIPAGTLLPAADGVAMIVRAVGQALALALRLAGPFVLASVVCQVSLGLLARLVPRLQVYWVALPGQILGGLLLLAALATTLLGGWLDAARDAFLSLPGGS